MKIIIIYDLDTRFFFAYRRIQMHRMLAVVVLLLTSAAVSAEQDVVLVIENHRFVPVELRIPADEKIRIVVDNRDGTPEEFESASLRAEKLVPGKTRSMLRVGPLKPGKYSFYGEFNEKTAQGVLIAE